MDLTRREREVLRLLASGASTQTVAARLFISPATARTHIHRILAKLGIHSRLEAVTFALRNSLI
jgi:two-component system nitrate/nitrite response regulator NarL